MRDTALSLINYKAENWEVWTAHSANSDTGETLRGFAPQANDSPGCNIPRPHRQTDKELLIETWPLCRPLLSFFDPAKTWPPSLHFNVAFVADMQELNVQQSLIVPLSLPFIVILTLSRTMHRLMKQRVTLSSQHVTSQQTWLVYTPHSVKNKEKKHLNTSSLSVIPELPDPTHQIRVCCFMAECEIISQKMATRLKFVLMADGSKSEGRWNIFKKKTSFSMFDLLSVTGSVGGIMGNVVFT